MKILITGVSGFVGLSLITKLFNDNSDDDISVFLLPWEKIPDIIKRNNINIYYGNISQLQAVGTAVDKQDIVIHLAGYIYIGKEILISLSTKYC